MKNQIVLLIAVLIFLLTTPVLGQVTRLNNQSTAGAEYVGWDGSGGTTSKPVDIKNYFTDQSIGFYTNPNATNGSSTIKMIIKGSQTSDDGYVGIGTATPIWRLDVEGGDINVSNGYQGYRIDDLFVLKYRDDFSNIIVGVDAGVGDNGIENTYVGFNSGNSNTSGVSNTFLGSSAGLVSTGDNNTFVGRRAGAANTTGSGNTFLGHYAQPGSNNLTNATAIGANAYVTQSNSLILGGITGTNGGTNTSVGIGVTAPTAKLHVVNNTNAYGVRSQTTLSSVLESCGVLGSSHSTANVLNVGVAGSQTANANIFNIGVAGIVNGNNLFNVGGAFIAGYSCVPTTSPFPINMGVYARAMGTELSVTQCAPGIGGYFQGDVYFTNYHYITSDVKFKDTIVGIKDALSVIARLKPRYYNFKRDSFPYMQLAAGKHYGLVAQEVDTVESQLVRNMIQPQIRDTAGTLLMDTLRFKALNYTELVPLALRAIQQLDTTTQNKISSCSAVTVPDSNYISKWSPFEKILCKSLIYDDGSKIGIPSTSTNVYVNVVNTGSSITAGKFEGGSKGLYGLATGTNATQQGILGESRSATTMNVGVKGDARRSTTGYNIGVQGFADSSSNVNAGVVASTLYNNNTSTNVGLYGESKNSRYQNFAGQFLVTDTIGFSYAVYASVLDTIDYAGYFNGDVHITGALTRGSDIKLKNDVQDFSADTSLAWLGQLEPKSYEYRRADYPELTLPAGTQYGFVAQDVEKVLPQLVKNVTHPETRDLNGNIISHRMEYKSVDYLSFVPLLVGALQAQESKIETQQHKIDSLSEVITDRLTEIENRLNGCCGTGAAFKNDESETTVMYVVRTSWTKRVII